MVPGGAGWLVVCPTVLWACLFNDLPPVPAPPGQRRPARAATGFSTTSGSRTVPPTQTRRRSAQNWPISAIRCLSSYPVPAACPVTNSIATRRCRCRESTTMGGLGHDLADFQCGAQPFPALATIERQFTRVLTFYGLPGPFCSCQRMLSAIAFTFAFSDLALSMVYGSGCWAPSTEPSSNTRRKMVQSPCGMKW